MKEKVLKTLWRCCGDDDDNGDDDRDDAVSVDHWKIET